MKRLNSLDLYDIRSQLSEEATIVQDTVGRFVGESVLPIIGECSEHSRFPAELVPQIAELGLLGGSGISVEFPPVRHMLNLESVITYEGTEIVHQLVVGKELTGGAAF